MVQTATYTTVHLKSRVNLKADLEVGKVKETEISHQQGVIRKNSNNIGFEVTPCK